MYLTIEKNIGETLYREFFYPCKTIRLYSKHGETRTFVEYTEASDYGLNICPNIDESEVAAGNAVLRLIAEGIEDYFFDNNTTGAIPVYTRRGTHWIKYEDVTDQWTNHYWTRLKAPLVGFKAVSKNGEPIFTSKQTDSIHYSVGETYSVDEKKMLANVENGFFFSPFIGKALSYIKKDEIVFMVVATGLVYIKNSWDDLCSSNLTIVKELSQKEIIQLNPSISKPKALCNGHKWAIDTETI